MIQTLASKPTPPALTPQAAPVLQRKCACGGTPLLSPHFELRNGGTEGGSGECEECRKKRLAGGLQAKRLVNEPGDRWEREADTMADTVLDGHRHPATGGHGAGPALMRSPAGPNAPGDLPASVTTALQSPGQPLEGGVRSFMENRFGCDFGRVRIHSDQGAARSARDVDALAYTVGQQVVFGAGQYAPGTRSGQRLLAHELAHTLQQTGGMPPVRRTAAGPFSVDGLYEKRAAEPDTVFFDRESPPLGAVAPESALDSAEEEKIKAKAKSALAADEKEITIYGFASEEGDPAFNAGLAMRRMVAVRNVLQREGFSSPRVIHFKQKASCSTDKYDYRMWRAVEMRSGTGASQRVCNFAQPAGCSAERLKALADARERALKFIDGATGALARLDKFIKNPADEPAVSKSLDKYFGNSHTAKTAQDVRDRVNSLRDFLSHIADGSGKVKVLCGTSEERTCNAGGSASTSNQEQSVIFCPRFFDDPSVKTKQEGILIHESSHGSNFDSKDNAYQFERVILILTTDQALANAQSISQFVMDLQGKSQLLGPAIADKVSGCDPQGGTKNTKLVQEALAWSQRWNTWAKYGTAQTYGSPDNTRAMSPFIVKHFGRADKAAIAGILDRYLAMDNWFKLFFDVQCATATAASCSTTDPVTWTLTRTASPSGGGPAPEAAQPAASGGGAGTGTTTTVPQPLPMPTPAAAAGNVTVCPAFFNLGTLEERVTEMYAGLAVRMPGVSQAQSRSYPKLAFDYKVHYWNVK